MKHGGQEVVELDVEVRTAVGTRACRRLRREGRIPANLYGHRQENVFLSVPEKQFVRQFRAGHRLMHLNFGSARETGMVKEVQYDSLGDRIVHVDFTRVSLRERVHLRVPIETIGVAKGAAGGGVFELVRKDLDVEGPAEDIPEKIELHVSDMAVGDMIRIKDIEIPASCKVLHADPDDVVVAIHEPRRGGEAAVEAEAEEPTEPEIAGKKPKEEEEEGGKGKKK